MGTVNGFSAVCSPRRPPPVSPQQQQEDKSSTTSPSGKPTQQKARRFLEDIVSGKQDQQQRDQQQQITAPLLTDPASSSGIHKERRKAKILPESDHDVNSDSLDASGATQASGSSGLRGEQGRAFWGKEGKAALSQAEIPPGTRPEPFPREEEGAERKRKGIRGRSVEAKKGGKVALVTRKKRKTNKQNKQLLGGPKEEKPSEQDSFSIPK